jgi:hypothetical protein
MLRWFTDFEHIASYVAIKLCVLALLLVIMWMLIEQQLQLAHLYGLTS